MGSYGFGLSVKVGACGLQQNCSKPQYDAEVRGIDLEVGKVLCLNILSVAHRLCDTG